MTDSPAGRRRLVSSKMNMENQTFHRLFTSTFSSHNCYCRNEFFNAAKTVCQEQKLQGLKCIKETDFLF